MFNKKNHDNLINHSFIQIWHLRFSRQPVPFAHISRVVTSLLFSRINILLVRTPRWHLDVCVVVSLMIWSDSARDPMWLPSLPKTHSLSFNVHLPSTILSANRINSSAAPTHNYSLWVSFVCSSLNICSLFAISGVVQYLAYCATYISLTIAL